MSCDHVEELAAVAAGMPAPAALDAHLAGCERCRAELAELRAALALADETLRPLAAAEPSPALRARIREAVAEAPARGWFAGAPRAWIAAAAVVVLATALAAAFAGRRLPIRERPELSAGVDGAPGHGTETAGTTVESKPDRASAGSPAGATERRPAPPPVAAASTDAAASRTPDRTDAVGDAVAGKADRTAVLAAGREPSSSGQPRPEPGPSRLAASRSRPARAGRHAEPEVLVPPGTEEALLRFVALVHERNEIPAALLAAGEPSPDLAEPAEIEIKPLEIAPLDPAETLGT